jgi:hypothetical protein
MVSYDSGSTSETACAPGTAVTQSWWQRAAAYVWGGLTKAWRAVFGREASAAPAAPNVFCTVKGEVSVINDEISGKSLVTFRPTKAYPPNVKMRVELKSTALSIFGVAIGDSGHASYFKTSKDVCTLDLVSVTPDSLLISDDGPEGVDVRARALHLGSGLPQEIVPVEEYSWLWDWGQSLALSEPIVRLRSFVDEMQVDASGVSSVRRTVQSPIAKVRARNPKLGDLPSDYVPKDGTSYVEVAAKADPLAAGTIAQSMIGVAEVAVMLCDRPWPAKRDCVLPAGSDKMTLPWGEQRACTAGSSVWRHRDQHVFLLLPRPRRRGHRRAASAGPEGGACRLRARTRHPEGLPFHLLREPDRGRLGEGRPRHPNPQEPGSPHRRRLVPRSRV